MKYDTEHGYATYPRRFDRYKWSRPIGVGILFSIFFTAVSFALVYFTKKYFGTTVSSTGYDDLDLFTAAGAFFNSAGIAAYIPCIALAALIVRDRPVSSYCSSMGGWRWKMFLKTLLAAFVILGIPIIITAMINGRTGGILFTAGGLIMLTLFGPFQGVAEEMLFRGYIMQTVSIWFKLPIIGLTVQTVIFAAIHPYNLTGLIYISVSAVLYALVAIYSKGLEAGSALHIVNNMCELYMAGFGFGKLTGDLSFSGAAVPIVFKTLFFLFILYADRKLHWFDEVKRDDVESFNARWNKIEQKDAGR
ncbi:MAG: CPBP family intramembrane metalloprotease [Eubacteriaceae bacterium]|nr:CPBP family intramembrane metalloprotease [Eubacteriaceae bacterium]